MNLELQYWQGYTFGFTGAWTPRSDSSLTLVSVDGVGAYDNITRESMLAGLAVAFVISIGSVSLPGSISFVVSIGPIALAMGVPVEPLALLVAVEMIPDIMRTLANVTADVALASATDRENGENTPDDATDGASAR